MYFYTMVTRKVGVKLIRKVGVKLISSLIKEA